EWVFRRHPVPQAAMVSNCNTLTLRGALREVAKVHGRPAAEIREVTSRMPAWYSDSDGPTLLAEHPHFRDLRLPAVWRELAATAGTLVGTPRHLSLHPGGVVIVPGTLTDVVPVVRAAKRLDSAPDLPVPAIQFDKDAAEDAGLVKIDLLGNRSLAVIRDGIAMVARGSGVQLDYTSRDAGNDPATRALFSSGNTMGVFYTESPASRLLNLRSRAESAELLVLNTSIIRPASNKFINQYLERLHGSPWQPLHPSLADTLAGSFGVMVYQEDVVNVAHDFAGLDLAAGDGLRKSLSKKRPGKLLSDYCDEFVRGARSLGRDEESIVRVWEMILSFAGYSFCKGHSCSYIQVAQQSGYLRAHHPAEFFAAVLGNGGGFYRPFAYVAEARRAGVRLLSPDLRRGGWKCEGRNGVLRVGMQFVKGLSAAGVERMLAARERCGGFTDLPSVLRSGIDREDLRLLIKVGACDRLSRLNRPQMLWWLDAHRQDDALVPEPVAVPDLPDYSTERKRDDEEALLGFRLEGHPMDRHRAALARLGVMSSRDLPSHAGQSVLLAGMYTAGKQVHSSRDEPMQFA
ncbi:MAG TPA: hypothetical protein PLL69_11785, partial [Gemmatimonadales bacterium]|nr:hypothetical protein [Gemmatimonadales bacterium]